MLMLYLSENLDKMGCLKTWKKLFYLKYDETVHRHLPKCVDPLLIVYTHMRQNLPERDGFYSEKNCLLQASKVGAAFLKKKNPNKPSNKKPTHTHGSTGLYQV